MRPPVHVRWRTKLGSIELLASMTSCARERLGACLPQAPADPVIKHATCHQLTGPAVHVCTGPASVFLLREVVPALCNVINDEHAKASKSVASGSIALA